MEDSIQLANRFKEVLLNGKWIANTNYKDQLLTITWEQSIIKIGSLNTIADLTFHINYYIAGVLNVFNGGTLDIRDRYSFALPIITSKEDWDSIFKSLIINSEEFAFHVERLTNEKLDDIFVDKKYGSYRRNIEGVIEHSYYHLGQISLIKKMILELEH